MSKTFDNLFDEFIGNDKTDSPAKRLEIKKVIQTIANFKKLDKGEVSEEQLDKELGEPTTTEEYVENGLSFTRLIWKTPHGEYIKVVMKDILPSPTPEAELPSNETLESLLIEAVAIEDYKTAIEIRDELKKRSEKK